MSEFLMLVTIGIALSLDAFSLALSVGTMCLKNRKNLSISICVGIFHLFMPLLGLALGSRIMRIFHLSGEFLVAGILFYIAFEMIRGILSKEEICWDMKIWGIISFAFGVSIDSFSVGLGLNVITNHVLIAVFLFAFCSFIFTYVGLIIGKYTKEKLGIVANIIGATLLIILGILHIF